MALIVVEGGTRATAAHLNDPGMMMVAGPTCVI